MICAHCANAGRWRAPDVKTNLHSKCPGGTWCDCQHRVEPKTIINKENSMTKVKALAVSLLVAAGIIISVATPAQAWSYCNDHASFTNYLTMFDNQGYCGTTANLSAATLSSGCHPFTGAYYDNWAASAVNNTDRDLIFSDNANCTGSASFALAAHTSHPNFYAVAGQNLGNRISSVRAI